MKRRRSPVNGRIRILLALLLVGFTVLLGRAAWLQAVQAGSLSSLAARQHRAEVVLPASRGTIFDRTGLQLAIGEQATTVYADPRQVRDARAVAVAAERTLGVDADSLYKQLVNKKRSFVYVVRKADPAKAAQLEKRQLAGLGFYPEERRFYPQGSVASHILGYAGLDNHGLAGLELKLDKRIAGRPGHETRVIDALGHVLDVADARPAVDGPNVRLTIDHTIQANAEAVLRQTVVEVGREGRDRRRARSAHRRRARDGGRSRLRRERVRHDASGRHAQPRGDRRVRAGLDVQARHGRGRALGPARPAADERSSCRRRFRLPTA